MWRRCASALGCTSAARETPWYISEPRRDYKWGEMAMAIRLHRKPVNFVVLVAMLTGFSGLVGADASTATAPAAPATAPVVQTIRPSTVCWPGLPLSEA